MKSNLTKDILSKLPKHPDIDIPPNVFVDMEGEFVAYHEGKSLTARFPVKERYQSPLRAMQGGMIVAAMDNTFGPLSYMVAPPSVTTHINATYLRPVTVRDQYIEVTATVVEISKNMLHMRAEAKNPKGELVAISQLINYFVKVD